ncbi:hypothetical protein PGIGA_G00070290 [Pangasianodon gigas]|uniref:Uncharacterized protein n=1 Tax=Pangasianodon gigas TaxID=30993 RepID=A0ACC5X7R2_PANGG|nr:hypothetical protein [Pangasianodon gigas]
MVTTLRLSVTIGNADARPRLKHVRYAVTPKLQSLIVWSKESQGRVCERQCVCVCVFGRVEDRCIFSPICHKDVKLDKAEARH